MLVTTNSMPSALPIALSDRIKTALFAVVFGALLLFGAGFAQSELLHSAAHDSRHAAGFPCH